MRLKASLWALVGIVWLASAAAIPRIDDAAQSTCSSTTEQSTAVATNSLPTPVVLTLTITPDDNGSPFTTASALPGSISASFGFPGTSSGQGNGSDFGSSSCTSETTHSLAQDTLGASGPITITVTESPATSRSTITIPVLTVTLSAPFGTTVDSDDGSFGSVSAATASSLSGHLESTLTVPVPESSDSDIGSILTVTLYTSPASPTTTKTILSWSSASTETFTIPLSLSGHTSGSSSQIPDSNSPFTVTYTLSPEPGLPTPFTGTITVTPLSLPPTLATESSSFSDLWQPITVTISEPDASSATVSPTSPPGGSVTSSSTSPSAAVVTYTVTPHDSSSAHTSVVTITQGVPTSAGSSADIVTVTETLDTVPIVPFTIPIPTSVQWTDHQSGASSISSSSQNPDVVTITVPVTPSSQTSAVLPTSFGSSEGAQPSVFTVTFSEATGSSPIQSVNVSEPSDDGYASVVTTVESVTTLTLSSVSSSSEPSSNDWPEVVTVTEPAITFTATPSSPINSWTAVSSNPSASVVAVTYTIPGESGADGPSYTVTYTLQPSATTADEYGSDSSPSWSDFAPSQATQSTVVETLTLGDGSASSSGGHEPFTLTVTPSDAFGTPVTITYTPGETGVFDTSAVAATASSNAASIVTITVPASTLTTRSSTANGASLTGSASGTVITVTLPSGSPIVVTIPDDRSATSLEGISTLCESSLGTVVLTVTPPSGSPVVVTLTSDSDLPTDLSSTPSATTTAAVLPVSSDSSSASGIVLTVTPVSGSPVVVTVPPASNSVSIPSNQVTVVTITEGLSSTPSSIGSSSDSLITVTPVSGSSVVITLSGSANEGTGESTTLDASPWSSSLLTATAPSALPYGISNTATVIVSDVTLRQTVSIGPDSSSVVEFTTQLTVRASSSPSTASVSTVLVTPVVASVTIPDIYGHGSTVLTYTTNLPVSASLPVSGSGLGGSGTVSEPIQSPEVITIWPSASFSSSSSPKGIETAVPSSSCTLGDGSIVVSTTSTAAQSDNPVPSEVTMWPPPGAVNSSCTTFSTSYRSSVSSTASNAPTSAPSVTTLLPVPTSTLDGTEWPSSCSETLSETPLESASIAVTDAAPLSIFVPEVSSDPALPSQTEFHHPAQAATNVTAAISTSTFGGYIFSASDAGYGNPVSEYGQPAPSLSTNSISNTETDLPFSQPTTDSATPIGTFLGSGSTPAGTISSLSLSVVEPTATESGIDCTTSLPISGTSLSASVSLTSSLVSFPSSQALTTPISLSTTVALPTISLISQSSADESSTVADVSSSQIVSSSSPLPTFANSTVVGNPTVASSDVVSSTNDPLGGSATLSSGTLTATETDIATPTTANATDLSTLPASITSPTAVNATGPTTLSSGSASASSGFNGTLITPGVTISTSLVLPTITTGGTSSAHNSDSIINTIRETASVTSVTPVFLNSTTPPEPPTRASPTVVNETVSMPTALLSSDAPALTSDALPTPILSTPVISELGTTAISTATSNEAVPSVSPSALADMACGAAGDRGSVVFEFDDIPTLAIDNADLNNIGPQPVPFPYHRFFFSNGFHVVPPPASKYEPSSGSQMLQYNSSSSRVANIGLAQLRGNPCFRFALQGIRLGCNSTDAPCVFDITALQWNGVEEVAQGNKTLEVAACPDISNCTLSHQILDQAAAPTFENLTAINITLVSTGQPQTWWADDLQIAWTDNDCTAAACRARVPNKIMTPSARGSIATKAKGLPRWAVRGQDVGNVVHV